MAIITFLINLYCLLTLVLVKELRKMDFAVVGVQTLFDLLISGCLSFVFFCFRTVDAAKEIAAFHGAPRGL